MAYRQLNETTATHTNDLSDAAPAVNEQLATLIAHAVRVGGSDETPLVELGREVLEALHSPLDNADALRSRLANFNFQFNFVADEQTAIRAVMLELLHVLFENIAELNLDEGWLQGRMNALQQATRPPLTLNGLESVRVHLQDVNSKHREAKAKSQAAQEEMKRLLSAFIERLSSMAESSGSFKGKVELYARQIEHATSLSEIAPVLQEAVTAARNMAQDSQRVGDELREMREKTAETESRLHQLEFDLERASALARNDPLTGALNRKGLNEAMDREIARNKRKGIGLSVALLDIDNFKNINDSLGHQVGDAALVHLTAVTRDCIRPHDNLGRYGGEEFVIVMPDTTRDQGIEVMNRVQRELAKRLLMTAKGELKISFSAGVSELQPNESGPEAIARADQAMYAAKRAGKNRVIGG